MIAMKEIIGNLDISTLPAEHQANLKILLEKINKVRAAWNKPMTVTSGYRSVADQMRINPKAPKSGHLAGACVDISDPNGDLRNWILSNLELMKSIGFWFEDFRYTKGWVHFSINPPASKKRIFIPIAEPPPHPELWDGKYDLKYDVYIPNN